MFSTLDVSICGASTSDEHPENMLTVLTACEASISNGITRTVFRSSPYLDNVSFSHKSARAWGGMTSTGLPPELAM